MNWLREVARRLRMLVHRRQFDADLEEEMQLHLELRQQIEASARAVPPGLARLHDRIALPDRDAGNDHESCSRRRTLDRGSRRPDHREHEDTST